MEGAVELTGRAAAILAAVEVGLGSLLHSFRVPLAGYFLSLNQAFLLSRATLRAGRAELKSARIAPFHISITAAALKSLAPAGKKLTPMLAISAQGFLYSLGTITLGANLAGAILGSILLSVWSFVQPVLIYYLFFGHTMMKVAAYLYEKTAEIFSFDANFLLWVLAGLFVFKALLAAGAAWTAFALSDERAARYEDVLVAAGSAKRERAQQILSPNAGTRGRTAARDALGDLFHPLFLISLAVTAVFFVYVEEAAPAAIVQAILRPLAVGFLIFFAVRTAPVERLVSRLPVLRSAIKILRNIK